MSAWINPLQVPKPLPNPPRSPIPPMSPKSRPQMAQMVVILHEGMFRSIWGQVSRFYGRKWSWFPLGILFGFKRSAHNVIWCSINIGIDPFLQISYTPPWIACCHQLLSILNLVGNSQGLNMFEH